MLKKPIKLRELDKIKENVFASVLMFNLYYVVFEVDKENFVLILPVK